jgi:uncharacterized protein involved in exopolysaccharide biosynthesis
MGEEEMAETPVHPRATTASVDRRIEGLEREVAELKTSLALVELEQKHIRELMSSQFAAIEANIKALAAKMEVVSNQLATALAGERDLEKLTAATEANQRFIQQVVGGMKALEQARIWLLGGGIATFLIALASLFHALGII